MDTEQLKTRLVDIGLCIPNEYLDKYVQLIIDNQDREYETFRTDKHHIVPRYFFNHIGQEVQDKDNIVILLFEDHVLAHYYLCFCSATDQYRLANICSVRFSCNKDFNRFENVTEEWIKENLSRYSELEKIHREESSKRGKLMVGDKNPFYGKTHTEKTKRKISLAKKGVKLSGVALEHVRNAVRNMDRTNQRETIRYYNLYVRDYSGHGKKISETKKKNKSGNNRQGKVKITNGIEIKYVPKEQVDSYFSQGWKYGYGSHYKNYSTNGMKKWVHRVLDDGTIERRSVLKEDFDEYLENGWKKGHGIKNQYERRNDLYRQ